MRPVGHLLLIFDFAISCGGSPGLVIFPPWCILLRDLGRWGSSGSLTGNYICAAGAPSIWVLWYQWYKEQPKRNSAAFYSWELCAFIKMILKPYLLLQWIKWDFEPIVGYNHYFYGRTGGVGVVITVVFLISFIKSFIISKIQFLTLVLYLSFWLIRFSACCVFPFYVSKGYRITISFSPAKAV